jgi:hypothetical protein
MTDKLTQRRWLETHGFICGDREPQLNTNYPGAFMVAEGPRDEWELPTEDGSNGPWCIVGDDLDALVAEAFGVWHDDPTFKPVDPDSDTIGSDPIAELVFAAECGLELLEEELSQREGSGIGEETSDFSRWVNRLDAAIKRVKEAK